MANKFYGNYAIKKEGAEFEGITEQNSTDVT